MMKKAAIAVIATAITITAVAPVHAAGISFDFSMTESNSTTETTKVEDSKGNVYDVVHTVETVNGKTSESYENVPVEFYNETADEIVGVYIASSDAETWGDNWLRYLGDDITLESGDHAYGLILNYYLDNPLIDILVETADGGEIPFEHFDLNNLKDPTHMNLHICEGEETGSYYVNFD